MVTTNFDCMLNSQYAIATLFICRQFSIITDPQDYWPLNTTVTSQLSYNQYDYPQDCWPLNTTETSQLSYDYPQDCWPLNTTETSQLSYNQYDYPSGTRSSNSFQITTVEDEVDEDPETFLLRLELAEDNDNILIPFSLMDQAVVTVLDDDGVYLCNKLYMPI